ncbi:NtaA/DmoA family FMN-dependent monooxygenase [Agromyces archimandritae]|uniref:NtaA/DmoA family FMN-dependent monooxygenase n=1 Tax=Agromyces archimandritae TaxID=2781962 RepID=A0A975IMP0_9MICO|nr:NtaA/DmoA family FMN-dependent monooxygenase [Agromyces archimandritae]QTX03665.1 NtaA/DmoA family FMN-dependent monooxygenase [Agromyces archimandritae]
MSRLILGAMVRAVGAYPSGWRFPGAHRHPLGDAALLKRTAALAEAARLDYLFFGDWLATGKDLEYRDPYLVARIDPLSAITFLAGVTERIGLIATANTTYADPYTLARATASVDILSGGRAGLNLVTGAEPRAAGNHGLDFHAANESRYDRAVEFEIALRRLWDSFDDDAIVADAETGVFLDEAKLHTTDFHGAHVSVTGPLNVARPPQGHLPIVHAGTSPRSRLFAAQSADLALVAVGGLDHALAVREELRSLAFESGRDDRELKVIAPVLPIIGDTLAEAQGIADRLAELLPVAEDWAGGPPRGFPEARSIRTLSQLVELELDGLGPDREISPRLAADFGAAGQALIELVAARTGRRPGGPNPPRIRHLVVQQAVPASMIVGTATDIADEFEAWADAGAVDGFNVLSAVQPAQFEAFALGVVPELQRRGVFPRAYETDTLRGHLGLARPANVHAHGAAEAGRAPASTPEPAHLSESDVK